MDERFMEIAADLEQLHRENAIRNASSQAVRHNPQFDGTHCVEDDCGEEIPAARLAMGKEICTACQAAREGMRKRYAAA